MYKPPHEVQRNVNILWSQAGDSTRCSASSPLLAAVASDGSREAILARSLGFAKSRENLQVSCLEAVPC